MSSVSSLSSALSSLLGGSSSSSSSNTPLTLNGLQSGLNTNSIIQGLLAVNQQKISNLNSQAQTVTSQQQAYTQLGSLLQTLQGDVSQLTSTTNGVFSGRTATSSAPSQVAAAASSSAIPGVYNLTVNSLAQAQQIASQGFNSPNDVIGQGTIQLQTGAGSATTITIDGTNNTLQGLANAINNSGANVTATIVNDGSGNTNQPYRLLLTSNATGTSNAISVTNNLTSSSGAAIPNFSSTTIGQADLGTNYTGTATPTSSGTYTGTTNNNYTFTVLNGGTVGTDDGLQIGYSDSTGTHTGTLTVNAADLNNPITVAQGVQVSFGAGTLVNGQTFSVKTYVPTVQAAANASVTLGSGAGALNISSSTNVVNNLIPGVTLSLQGANPSTPVSITVGNNAQAAQKVIDNFVSDYNNVLNYVNQQTAYSSSTGQAGTLLGDSRVSQIQSQLSNVIINSVPGINKNLNQLAAIGITVNNDGTLAVNDATVANVLGGNVSGVSIQDVQNLFGLSGTTTNPGVQFVTGSASTHPSGSSPYTVNITHAATQASATATTALASSVTIDNTNNTLSLSVDGTSGTVTLANGTYNATSLAQAVQGAINNSSAFANHPVTVGVQSNQLTITSSIYGGSSKVSLGAGNANTALGFSGSETSTGTDVAGSFVVNGVTETANGYGQYLIGANGNANTSGLQIKVALSQAQVGAGTTTNLSVNSGIANQLNNAINGITDPLNGILKNINDGFTNTLTTLKSEVTSETKAMTTQQTQLQQEFTQMETALAALSTASSAVNMLYGSVPSSTSTSTTSTSSGSLSKATVG